MRVDALCFGSTNIKIVKARKQRGWVCCARVFRFLECGDSSWHDCDHKMSRIASAHRYKFRSSLMKNFCTGSTGDQQRQQPLNPSRQANCQYDEHAISSWMIVTTPEIPRRLQCTCMIVLIVKSAILSFSAIKSCSKDCMKPRFLLSSYCNGQSCFKVCEWLQCKFSRSKNY